MRVKYLLLLSILTFMFVGCEDKDADLDIIGISESSSNVIKGDGEKLEVEVRCAGAWAVSSKPNWCKVAPESGSGDQILTITVDANLETSTRTGEVKISSGSNSKSIRFSQAPADISAEAYHYDLPVIFHVMYKDKSDDLQYVDAERLSEILGIVNKLYQDKSKSVDMNLTFTLATTNPEGKKLDIPGVEYILWPDSYPIDCDLFMKDDETNGGKGYVKYLWDPNQYINVMIYNFKEDLETKTTTLGISHLPFTTTGSNSLKGLNEVDEPYLELKNLSFPYCVSINSFFIYQQSDSKKYNPADVTVTLAHELGHYLGLHHVFSESEDGGCEDTDYCGDTPSYNKEEYDNYYAYAIGHIPNDKLFETLVKRNNCENNSFISYNIMDYSVSYSDQFTQDQYNRVRHVLAYSPLIPGPKKGQGRARSAAEGFLKLPIRVVK